MKCELIPGIASISGTLKKEKNGDRLVCKTFKRPNGKTETRAYIIKKESFQRTNPPSEKELAARALFAKRQARVTQLIANRHCQTPAEAWRIAKAEIPAT